MDIMISLQEYKFDTQTTKIMQLEPVGNNKVSISIKDSETNRSVSIELHISELQKALSKLAL